MEYLNGHSLKWNLNQLKVFSEEVGQFYSAQVLCAILFLHNNKIVQRLGIDYITTRKY